MAKISQKELEYIKRTISPEQLLDLVSLNSRIQKRKMKLGRINESEDIISLEETGFPDFFSNLDNQSKNLFREIFQIFQSNNSGSNIQGKIYSLFQQFLKKSDEYISDDAN